MFSRFLKIFIYFTVLPLLTAGADDKQSGLNQIADELSSTHHGVAPAPPMTKDIGNILYIGDGHEAWVSPIQDDERNGPFKELSCAERLYWHYCNVAWLWHLHRILVDHGIRHEFVGAEQFYVPTDYRVYFHPYILDESQYTWNWHENGHLAHIRQVTQSYRGTPFNGRALTSYGRRASEISGRTSINDRYKELWPYASASHSTAITCYSDFIGGGTTTKLNGELDWDEGNIYHWLGLKQAPSKVFSLKKNEIPDIAIIRAGLQDLINDTVSYSKDGLPKSKRDTVSINKAMKNLLGSPKKNSRGSEIAGAKRKDIRQLGDMGIIVGALREANPDIRIIVLPLALYSEELLFRNNKCLYRYSERQRNNLPIESGALGMSKKEITELQKVVNKYNRKLEQWCNTQQIEYLPIPEWHVENIKTKGPTRWYLTVPTTIAYSTAYHVAHALGVSGGATFGFPRKSADEMTPLEKKENSWYKAAKDIVKTRQYKGVTAVLRYEKIDAEYRIAWISIPSDNENRNPALVWVWKDDMLLADLGDFDLYLSHMYDTSPELYFPIVVETHDARSSSFTRFAGKLTSIVYTTEGCFAPPIKESKEKESP